MECTAESCAEGLDVVECSRGGDQLRFAIWVAVWSKWEGDLVKSPSPSWWRGQREGLE